MLLLSRVKVSPPPDGRHPRPLSASLHFPGCAERSRWTLSKLSLSKLALEDDRLLPSTNSHIGEAVKNSLVGTEKRVNSQILCEMSNAKDKISQIRILRRGFQVKCFAAALEQPFSGVSRCAAVVRVSNRH